MNFHTLLALSMLPGYFVAFFYAPLPYVGFAYALMCTFSIVYHANANKNDENTTIKSRRLDYIFQEVLIMSHLFLLNEPPIVKYCIFCFCFMQLYRYSKIRICYRNNSHIDFIVCHTQFSYCHFYWVFCSFVFCTFVCQGVGIIACCVSSVPTFWTRDFL